MWERHKEFNDKEKKDPLFRYKKPKKQNVMLASLLEDIGKDKESARVLFCSDALNFITDTQKKNKILLKRYSCKNRFCPLCQQARARRDNYEMITILNYLNQQKTRAGNVRNHYIFLTLTIPNVKDTPKSVHSGYYKLQYATVAMLNQFKGWGKTKHGKRNKGWLKGYYLKHEETVSKRDWSINLHEHLVLVVKPSYYRQSNYLSFKKWEQCWQKVLNTKEFRELFVEKPYYRDRKGKHTLDGNSTTGDINKTMKAMSEEMSKYENKSQDLASILKNIKKPKHSPLLKVFNALYFGLKNTRRGYNYGIFYFLNQQFNKGNLKAYEPKSNDNSIYEYDLIGKYNYQKSNYSHNYQKFDDSRIRYVRKHYGVKTILTSNEKRNNSQKDMKFDNDKDILIWNDKGLHIFYFPDTITGFRKYHKLAKMIN